MSARNQTGYFVLNSDNRHNRLVRRVAGVMLASASEPPVLCTKHDAATFPFQNTLNMAIRPLYHHPRLTCSAQETCVMAG